VRRATLALFIAFAYKVIFQSTLSVRRATLYKDYALVTIKISIHALREESDPYGSPIKIGIRGIRGIRDKEGLM
jgi:hypothetical protein